MAAALFCTSFIKSVTHSSKPDFNSEHTAGMEARED